MADAVTLARRHGQDRDGRALDAAVDERVGRFARATSGRGLRSLVT